MKLIKANMSDFAGHWYDALASFFLYDAKCCVTLLHFSVQSISVFLFFHFTYVFATLLVNCITMPQ